MRKKLSNVLNNKDVGAIGIGAMIIFIAMVLVAGIAASVLIQTSTNLEMQALRTGSQTVESVASGILVQGVEGYNASGVITRLAVEIRPRAGSPDIDLQTTIIEISDSNNKFILTYGGQITAADETAGCVFTGDSGNFYPGVSTGTATTDFFVIVLQDADGSFDNDPVLNYGDHVIIAIGNVFSGLTPRTGVQGMVIPEEGSPGVIDFRTPESFTDAVMELQ